MFGLALLILFDSVDKARAARNRTPRTEQLRQLFEAVMFSALWTYHILNHPLIPKPLLVLSRVWMGRGCIQRVPAASRALRVQFRLSVVCLTGMLPMTLFKMNNLDTSGFVVRICSWSDCLGVVRFFR